MYKELRERSPQRFASAVNHAFTALCVFFSAFATAGYTLFGISVKSDLLYNLPLNLAGHAARLGMLVIVLSVFPLALYPIMAPVRTWASSHQYPKKYISPSPEVSSGSLASPCQRDSCSRSPSPMLRPRTPPHEYGEFQSASSSCYSSGDFFRDQNFDHLEWHEHPEPKSWQAHGRAAVAVCTKLGAVALVTWLAMRFDNLGKINIISGALGVFAFVGFTPAIIGLYLLDPTSRKVDSEVDTIHTRDRQCGQGVWAVGMWLLLLGSFFMSVAGLMFVDNDAPGLDRSCLFESKWSLI